LVTTSTKIGHEAEDLKAGDRERERERERETDMNARTRTHKHTQHDDVITPILNVTKDAKRILTACRKFKFKLIVLYSELNSSFIKLHSSS
jgi:hypothetical protein